VTSLETKIQETEQRFEETDKLREEWLKKATDAESQINELKSTMQRFSLFVSNINS
jgi:myosin-5